MLLLYTNFFKRYVIFVSSEPKGQEKKKSGSFTKEVHLPAPQRNVSLHHIGAPTHTHALHLQHSLCTAFSSSRLSVSWSSLSCLFFVSSSSICKADPLRHGCCRALLSTEDSSNSILSGRSSPVRLCLTAYL